MSGLIDLGVAGIAAAIARGEVSSVEATRAALDALDGEGRRLNAVARLEPERALRDAAKADDARARGDRLGLLHGVPMAHKDMFYRAGELAECGAKLRKGHRPTVTSTAIAKLDAAGAIDVGRLNMVEFALGITGHNAHTGHPRNAWDPERITGGSTSGGATAVAAGLVPGTLGSDTGGSIRAPAALCGLVGLKPTYGRVSRFGCMPLSFSLDHVGPLARTAIDVALLTSAICGQDAADPTTSRRAAPDLVAGIDRGVRGLRVLQATDLDVPVDPEIGGAVTRALKALEGQGATVDTSPLPPFGPLNALRRTVMLAECAAIHRESIRTSWGDYNPQTSLRMAPGFAMPTVDYLRALDARTPTLQHWCATVFAKADILALPTSPVRTPRIADTDTGGDQRFQVLANAIGAFLGPFNYMGLPALSVPVGFDSDGMPIGLQLVARPFAEGILLRAAQTLESALGLTSRRPPRRG